MKYFLVTDAYTEREVTKEEYVKAERSAGIENKHGRPLDPETSRFTFKTWMRGWIEFAEGEEIF